MKEVVRYSEAFKRNIVEKVESGMYATLGEAQRKNGICRGSFKSGIARKAKNQNKSIYYKDLSLKNSGFD